MKVASLALLALLIAPAGFAVFSEQLDPDFVDKELAQYFSGFYQETPSRAAAKLDRFGSQLKLEIHQKEHWLRFKFHFLDQVENRQQYRAQVQRFKQQHRQPMTALEALQFRENMIAIRLKETQQSLIVVQDLYQTLNPQQKSMLDTALFFLWHEQAHLNHRKF